MRLYYANLSFTLQSPRCCSSSNSKLLKNNFSDSFFRYLYYITISLKSQEVKEISVSLSVLPSEEDLDKAFEDFKADNIPEGIDFDEWLDGLEPTEDGKLVFRDKRIDNGGGSGIIKLSSKFINPNEKLYRYANYIKPIDGYCDIVCHGSPNELIIRGFNGEEWTYSAKQAAEMIRNSAEFNDKKIRLIS